ncbi:S41 family peptidase [Aureivirga sp. CE67]|uniref:S41 family peptidase n=1 Tax=Aureivirga sp. CE67 TaxID=1788983 RepID=UPI0018CA9E39|nr:S41 family peptidase [Aureivirga sp. CE67]
MKKLSLILGALVLFLTVSCNNDDDGASNNVPSNLEVQNFIWKGLNSYYFWKDDVPNLANDRFSSQNELNQFLESTGGPNEVFESLLYQRGTSDKWSWIVDDYIALEKSFQGISKSNGMEFRLYRYENDPTRLYGAVIYVIPNSDAASKNISRGQIFTKVNGTNMTESNYRDLLFDNDTYTISFAHDYNGGNPEENGEEASLTKVELDENPILINEVIEMGGKKVGYLMYNGFVSSYDKQLNNAFAELKAAGITDLVLDLRYNGGGSVRTATYLASLITGQFTGQVASQEKWNSEVQDYFQNNNPSSLENRFVDQMTDGTALQSLNLSEVYVLTSNGSASASELLINSLLPYITVKKIGDVTRGKYVGSITLYDSQNYGRDGANPNHKWAMQPIVLAIENSQGQNFPQGISPDTFYKESPGSLGDLGTIGDVLLALALEEITGEDLVQGNRRAYEFVEEVDNSRKHAPLFEQMYVDLKE